MTSTRASGMYDGELKESTPAGTRVVTADFGGERVDLLPPVVDAAFELTVNAAAEYIQSKERVTLVVPLIGGIPLADRVLRQLQGAGYTMDRIDLRFGAKIREEGQTAPTFVVSEPEKPAEKDVVMIDDIGDELTSYRGIKAQIRPHEEGAHVDMICFTPIIKDNEGGKESTEDFAAKYDLSIAPIGDPQGVRDINFALKAQNIWIDGGFGMDSSMMPKLAGTDLNAAKYEAAERLTNVCLTGEPKNPREYYAFLRMNSSLYDGSMDHPLFAILMVMTYTELYQAREGLSPQQIGQEKIQLAKQYFADNFGLFQGIYEE